MKVVTKKRITLIAFLLCAVLSVVGVIVSMKYRHPGYEDTRRTIYASTELIQIKRGEKVAFSDANEYFAEFMKKAGDKFQVHSQGAYHLTNEYANVHPDSVASMIYIDKDGYINATTTGVFQLEYVFSVGELVRGESAETIGYDNACVFTALVCVYEGDEDKFEPLPDDPSVLDSQHIDNPINYIMTKDVTWKGSSFWTVGNFYGTLLNPNGYTLTWDIGIDTLRKRQARALFGNNYGYIDGLKVKVVGGETSPNEAEAFYGLVQRNRGVLQNCKIEGTVKISQKIGTSFEPAYFYALPKHGFTFNNEARMTVYTNNKFYAYNTAYFGSGLAGRLGQSNDNKVYLDVWYYDDEIKAQRRDVETILATEYNSNTCEHLLLGKAADEEKTITLQIPKMGELVGEKEYDTLKWTANVNTPLSVEGDWWEIVRYTRNKATYDDVEVKYWLVNGKKVDTLNEVVVTEDLTIEPCVQYKETKYAISNGFVNDVYNTKKVLDLSNVETQGETLTTTLYCLGEIFADPRCVKPTTIIIGKNTNVRTSESSNNEKYLFFLLDFLQNGGQLIVNSENPYVSFIDGKYFCDEKGKSLYYYFPSKDETELTLHPQITEFLCSNTFFGSSGLEKLHLNKVNRFNALASEDLINLKEINLGTELNSNASVYSFLSRIPTLEKIEVEEGNLRLKAVDNFVWDNYSTKKELIFAPATLKGEVKVPEGIQILGNNCFMGSDITHLIFPDSLTTFNELAIDGMKMLEKITFGASTYLNSSGGNNLELPELKTIIFNDATEKIEFTASGFLGANLELIVLPKNLGTALEITSLTKAYQISAESPYWKTVDGVLYFGSELTKYPRYKQGEAYTVLDGTSHIGANAFYETALKEVIFPESCIQVKRYAFQGSQIESVEFKSTDLALMQNAFYGCEQLSNVTVKENTELKVYMYAFKGCGNLSTFPYQNVNYIANGAFDSTGIEYFEIGEEVTYLGQEAFALSGLKNVVIKTTQINAISASTFKNTQLESVELSNSITLIESEAFKGCKNLTAIDLKNVIEISDSAFMESGITSVQNQIVEIISANVFNGCENLTTVSMPKVYQVDESAFAECGNLEQVQFAKEVSVGAYAFLNCYSLEEVPFVITNLDIKSFEGCASLKKATIEADIEERCVRVFADCTSLEEVTITGENIVIGTEFFAGCTSLEKVFITYSGAEGGKILGSAFGALTQKIEVYLNVPETFVWEEKVPDNLTVYVPEEYVDKFADEWLAEEGQIVGFNWELEERE